MTTPDEATLLAELDLVYSASPVGMCFVDRDFRFRRINQKLATINVRVTPELKRACEVAAKRSHLTLPDWVRAVFARAANEGAFAPRKGGKRRGAKR